MLTADNVGALFRDCITLTADNVRACSPDPPKMIAMSVGGNIGSLRRKGSASAPAAAFRAQVRFP